MSKEYGLESPFKGQLKISNMFSNFFVFLVIKEFYFFLMSKVKSARIKYKGF